ncbi:carboxymuconolactone decarboxylase family protein [Actinokineospora xionganensis]|uniref:Carboxymuconolactone decarboxylase family protein n=1 Tax=Actinokineospora xionganensis TaxID=2684470 RepID=A0ABR7LFN2_9PSEU|nr:carboxymuconolactone decarboxylase family protein [Actinokineospora xionganensis]MBC6451500.1 carboxymuconolactone decarboxylase family protein [Actinokineospora xionganensis]
MRIQPTTLAPELYRKLVDLHLAVDKQAVEAGVERSLLELVRIRASQLNGCAFCVDMHTTAAMEAGETPRRLHALPVWAGTGFFSDRERAALALAESVTLLSERRVPEVVYGRAEEEFDKDQLAQLIWAITVVNTFNRLAVIAELQPQ